MDLPSLLMCLDKIVLKEELLFRSCCCWKIVVFRCLYDIIYARFTLWFTENSSFLSFSSASFDAFRASFRFSYSLEKAQISQSMCGTCFQASSSLLELVIKFRVKICNSQFKWLQKFLLYTQALSGRKTVLNKPTLICTALTQHMLECRWENRLSGGQRSACLGADTQMVLFNRSVVSDPGIRMYVMSNTEGII